MLAEQLKETIRKMKEDNSSSDVMKWFKSSRYDLLKELCLITDQNDDNSSRRRKVADAVDRLIEDLQTSGDKVKEWEKRADCLYDNVFSDFKTDFPKLKDVDYRLFLFTVLGLEIPTITFLLKEEKIGAVYNRKRRLKVKISNSDNENKERYLSFFI